jgi:Carboxypeptidase regulatory-like domain
VQAQSGKHIALSCTIGLKTFNPGTVLLTEVQSLINNLRTNDTADPITAYVVDSNGLGISGATVSIKDSFPHTVATATTDITGFYFFPTTGVLASGSSYTVQVTALPSGFTTSTPASQPFTWLGNGIVPSTIVLK